MTTCTECRYSWGGSPEHAVGDFPDQLSRLLRGVRDSDGWLRARPAAEVWSPLEYLAHTGDAIGWYAARISRILTEDRPCLDPFDWDAHTAGQRYHERHLTDVLATVRGTCAGLTAGLQALTATEWARQGIGSDGSVRTVAQLADRAGHEAHHHLRDIELGLQSIRPTGRVVTGGNGQDGLPQDERLEPVVFEPGERSH